MISKKVKEVILNISLLALAGIVVVLFYQNDFLATALLLMILIIGLVFGYRKNDIIFTVIGAVCGLGGEIIILHFSDVFRYTHPTFLNVQIWSSITYGIIVLIVKRTTEILNENS